MRLYPKLVPIIAREVIQRLSAENDIEVEPIRASDAEMDLSAIMREYLANEERVNQATREALERRGYDSAKFTQVKREMADVRGFKLGEDGIEFVINQMLEFLLVSRNVEEVFSDDTAMRPKILQVMKKHLDIEDEIDREARGRLKHLARGHQRLRDRVPEDRRADPPRARPDLSHGSCRAPGGEDHQSFPPVVLLGRPEKLTGSITSVA